jgi:nicotinamidase-related amidase
MTTQLIRATKSQLAIIDVQSKLCAVMPAEMQVVIKNISILVQAAHHLQVPVLVTEQYPQALGETVPEIAQHCAVIKPIEKMAFSAYAEPKFKAQCQRDKSQIILAGLETHICVLQTALDLIAQGKQVIVVEDAVISRNVDNKRNAINRLANAGCIIANTESVVFEWLGHAKHEAFKEIAKLIK